MDKTKKVGFLGGTFNPIHYGHLMIAESAREYLDLDEVLLMPSGHSYMKSVASASAEHRLAMTRLAARDYPHFTVSDMEIRRGGNTYTADTIDELRSTYPQAELYFIIGADTLLMMDNWSEPARIFAGAKIAVAVRDFEENKDIGGASADHAEVVKEPSVHFTEAMKAQTAYLKEKYHADIIALPIKAIELSSSTIRARIKAGRPIGDMVPEAVTHYINEHKLYR
ncbi:MAG: nicotinate-nucleotide adenylyltransferase [Lachnospiraceae bacterium]|jgi:nicotinate-nucleotide adenylyltransferase|nr:nicotinate-nucleotide adenylyltransferase [Lachnospiraceae bacterium]